MTSLAPLRLLVGAALLVGLLIPQAASAAPLTANFGSLLQTPYGSLSGSASGDVTVTPSRVSVTRLQALVAVPADLRDASIVFTATITLHCQTTSINVPYVRTQTLRTSPRRLSRTPASLLLSARGLQASCPVGRIAGSAVAVGFAGGGSRARVPLLLPLAGEAILYRDGLH